MATSASPKSSSPACSHQTVCPTGQSCAVGNTLPDAGKTNPSGRQASGIATDPPPPLGAAAAGSPGGGGLDREAKEIGATRGSAFSPALRAGAGALADPSWVGATILLVTGKTKAPSRGQTPGTATDPPTTLEAAATVSPRSGWSTTSTTLCAAADSASTNPSMPCSTAVNSAVADALATPQTPPALAGPPARRAPPPPPRWPPPVPPPVGSTLPLGAPAASSPAA